MVQESTLKNSFNCWSVSSITIVVGLGPQSAFDIALHAGFVTLLVAGLIVTARRSAGMTLPHAPTRLYRAQKKRFATASTPWLHGTRCVTPEAPWNRSRFCRYHS